MAAPHPKLSFDALHREGTMDRAEIEQAVEAFAAAKARGEHFPAAWHDRLSLDDAFRIQLALVQRAAAADPKRRRIGWKVGLTAVAITAP